MDRAAPFAAAILGLLAGFAVAPLPAQDEVTIYRCVDARGQVSIGNVPCRDGQRQETRSMARPVDGARPAAAPGTPAPVPAASPVVRYVVSQPPQPLYECVRPDGSTYESESGDGDPRWIPLWTQGWPVAIGGRGDVGRRGATTPAGNGLSAPPVSRISIPHDPPRPDPGSPGPRPPPPHDAHAWPGGGAGTWERDQCHVLPEAEACDRLRDRRDDIRRRFFNAQQRERDTLRLEERGVNARIDRDCRTY
ncbi:MULTISPECIES: DUF4124 domain-containing protein [unclassified Luteimonas]|uniref:DUF4124 domain-containing protein n=1 Tax=unclassified Luteimonas TaxID=2629088 RepID=UPI001600FE65|nr:MULTISPECIES: DUF4124 domain-containing protein [unclassified Luteimonas]MBB1473476.1 DUF4124 domain-containing protein [Luteimonas sp. MC1782]MBB6600354.1 DUF4124 domain-containing protein [Luteimonas sp. MC1825]QOC88031.1 DUF4124 domain-containing protein [Luteimonas sp. MC1825]